MLPYHLVTLGATSSGGYGGEDHPLVERTLTPLDRFVTTWAADAARCLGMTPARVSQITNLLLLAPEIQKAILDLPLVTRGRDPITERQLRIFAQEPVWSRQLKLWRKNDV